MFKSLAGKVIMPVAIAVTGFVVVCCLLLYSVLKEDMTVSAVRQATVLANTVVKSTRHAMLLSDDGTLRNIIDNISSQEGVEHVRIFNKKGLVKFSSSAAEVGRNVDKKTAGCIECHAGPTPKAAMGEMQRARHYRNEKGHDVIAITSPIYNEPDCFTASCHVHPSGRKVLGTLDIGLSRQPLRDELATMRFRMTVFTLMVLVLTVGGVAALLGHAITGPLGKITAYCEAAARGERPDGLPSWEGQIGRLAVAVARLASPAAGGAAADRNGMNAESRVPDRKGDSEDSE